MRKVVLLSISLLIAAVVQAQISKGDIQLGGSLTYSNTESGGLNTRVISALPRAGLFISETTVIGLSIGYDSQTNDVIDPVNNSVIETTSKQFLFGAYARFHKPLGDNFYLYLQPEIQLGTGENRRAFSGDTNSINSGLSPGITYFLSPKFAVELNLKGLRYSRTKIDNAGNETIISELDLGVNLGSVGMGINFFIK